MHNTVANVFKIIIGTVLLGITVTLVTAVADCFITVTRIQNVTEFVKMDIAQNNCLLNDTYDMYARELYSISSQSRHLRVGTAFASGCVDIATQEGVANAHGLGAVQPIELTLASTNADGNKDWFIQKENTASGVETAVQLNPATMITGTSAPASSKFYVANYGDILKLTINMRAVVSFWAIAPEAGTNGATLDSDGWLTANVPVTLSYNIPALAYLK